MMPPLDAHFDPENPLHRTVEEWRRVGNQGWFVNAVVFAIREGEVRVLLRCGGILRISFAQPGPIDVEEL